MQVGIDQRQELPGGEIRIVDVEMAGKRQPGESGGKRGPGLARTVLSPAREQLGIALALVLDQPAQELAVAAADAVGVEAKGEGGEVGLEIVRMIGEGGERREEAGIGALGDVADDRLEQVFLVAVMIVDRLARDAGLRGDQVDVGAAIALAAENLGGRVDDRQPLGCVRAGQGGETG